MERMRKGTILSALAAGAVALTSVPAASADSYWRDGSGNVWRSGFGECWQSDVEGDTPAPGCEPESSKVETVEEQDIEVAALETEPTLTTVELDTRALFDFDSPKLRPEDVREIRDIAAKAKGAYRLDSIYIAGHTDSVGTDAYNRELSKKRAKAVKEELVKAGISEDVIRTEGFGETEPVADNSTAAGRQENRRVTVDILVTEREG